MSVYLHNSQQGKGKKVTREETWAVGVGWSLRVSLKEDITCILGWPQLIPCSSKGHSTPEGVGPESSSFLVVGLTEAGSPRTMQAGMWSVDTSIASSQ